MAGLSVFVPETPILEVIAIAWPLEAVGNVIRPVIGLPVSVPRTLTVEVEMMVWPPEVVVMIVIQEPSDS